MAIPNYANKFNPYLTPFTRVLIDRPFTGVAYRGVYLESLERLDFQGLNIKNFSFTRDAFALCVKDKFHLPPVYSCECGFYSFKDLVDAQEYTVFHKGALVVEVELYGEIIEHEIGYRSRELSVTKVFIPGTCSYKTCTKDSSSIKANVKVNSWRCSIHKISGATELKSLKFEYSLI